MTLCMDLVKQYMRDNPQLKVLIVDSEHNIDVGTQGHTDWGKLKGLEADSVVFDDLCKQSSDKRKLKANNKPLYTTLQGRWGK